MAKETRGDRTAGREADTFTGLPDGWTVRVSPRCDP